jgi:hypothetical protein
MNCDVGCCRRNGFRELFPILQHQFACAELRKVRELFVPLALEGLIVIGSYAVDPCDGVAAHEQSLRQVKADEAGSAGHEKTHASYRGAEPMMRIPAHVAALIIKKKMLRYATARKPLASGHEPATK